ncbi:MAG: hypothetical protein ACR2NG_05700 [Acidimicrobiia bacterium]
MIDFLLPSTDAGVAVQIGTWVLLAGIGIYATRRKPDARLLVIGVAVAGLGVMAVRAVH